MKLLKLFVSGCLLLSSWSSFAQVDAGIGAEIGFPLMFNHKVNGHNHASGAPGARAVINYAPENGSFSGTFIASISPMILPMVRFNGQQDVLYMDFSNKSLTLLGRFRKKMPGNATLLYGVGIGANFIKGTNVQISKRSDNDISRIIEDSTIFNKATLPAFYLNAEYIRPLGTTGKFFYGIGGQIQYMYLLDQGIDYRIDMIDKYGRYFSLHPALTGQVVNPMVYVNLYYRLGK